MKAVFFLLDGETNASSRHRVLQYFPLFRRHGIQPVACRPVPETVYQRLVEHGRHTTGSKAAFYSLFFAQRALDVLHADRFDVGVIQRDLFPFGPPWLERALAARNARLVYDTDDATYLRPAFTPDTPFQRWRRFDKVADVVSRARWVSVATEPIGTWARRYNPSVTVVPMAVDVREYQRARVSAQSTANGGATVIGWAGTAGGLRYLESLGPVLRELAASHNILVRVISGGFRNVRLPGVPVEARPWRPATSLVDMASFDVGVVPLDDTPFERAKFPFKLLQYLALGVPSVSARVGAAVSLIREGTNGLMASSADEWRDQIESLIVDPTLRRRLANAGQETVAACYSLERVGRLLVDGLTHAAA
jgi:glycosyltransferase involved in cell wall biosynthesis